MALIGRPSFFAPCCRRASEKRGEGKGDEAVELWCRQNRELSCSASLA